MIIAIIQARAGSTRLPGKVLKKVCGRALLEHEISRVKRSALLDKIVLATTKKELDHPATKFPKTPSPLRGERAGVRGGVSDQSARQGLAEADDRRRKITLASSAQSRAWRLEIQAAISGGAFHCRFYLCREKCGH